MPNCALSGFWEINDYIVARIWKVDYDLGSYKFIGRGQCQDEGGRIYAGWSGRSNVSTCKAVCDRWQWCVGVEVPTDGLGCSVRFDAEGVYDMPDPIAPGLPTFEEGDDATGEVVSTRGPWDRVCYGKGESAAEPNKPDAYGKFWRIAFYPRSGQWPYGDSSPQEAPLTLSMARPSELVSCDNTRPIAAASPFVTGVSTWWATQETNLWAGVLDVGPRWMKLFDVSTWDTSFAIGGGRCSIDQDILTLPGKKQSIQHALWGLRDCSDAGFRRLRPEIVDLTARGWSEVSSYRWLYGVEVFTRRLIAARGWEVANQSCFDEWLRQQWQSLLNTPLESVTARLVTSRCIKSP